MAHALWMLENWGYRHTLRICNSSCFCTATVVTRTRLNVTFISTLLVWLLLKVRVTVTMCQYWITIHLSYKLNKLPWYPFRVLTISTCIIHTLQTYCVTPIFETRVSEGMRWQCIVLYAVVFHINETQYLPSKYWYVSAK